MNCFYLRYWMQRDIIRYLFFRCFFAININLYIYIYIHKSNRTKTMIQNYESTRVVQAAQKGEITQQGHEGG